MVYAYRIQYVCTNSPFKYSTTAAQSSQVYSHPFSHYRVNKTERMREHFKKEIPMQYENQFQKNKEQKPKYSYA